MRGKVPDEAVRLGPVGRTTTDVVGRPDGTLARPAQALLLADLDGGARHFAAALGARVAGAAVRHLGDVGLVEHRPVRFDGEDFIRDFNFAKRGPGRVNHLELHFATFLAERTWTSAPIGPGTDPATKMTFCSSFLVTISRLRTVTRSAPMWPAMRVPLKTRPGVVPEPMEPGAR